MDWVTIGVMGAMLGAVAPAQGIGIRPATVGKGVVCGQRAASATAVGSGAVLESSGQALGEQRTLITLINFADDPSTPFTGADVDLAVLDATNPASTASWVQEVSYGRAWLSGDVLGWYTMPWDDGGICLLAYEGQTQTIVDELDPLIDFSAYDRWLIFIPPNAGCPFSGYSSLGKMTFDSDEGKVQLSRIIMNGSGAWTSLLAAHELGHSMAGLQHSRDYECGDEVVVDSCAPTNLGSLTDPYGVMGQTSGGGHYTAPDKDALGWLGSDVTEVPVPGGSYSLLPFESAAPGLKVLRIPASYNTEDTARAQHYYVSYRKPLGFDAGFTDLATDAAMIHLDSRAWVGEAVRRSWLLDMSPGVNADAAAQAADSADALLGVGGTYTDVLKGITISVTGVTDGRLDVSVTYSSYCGNGVVDPGIGEECDGPDLAGASCGSLGRLDGTLSCSADCTYDIDRCGLSLCGDGHAYDPSPACTATFLADPSDSGLWRSRDSFTAVREDPWAKGVFSEIWISVMMKQQADGWTWFHKASLPFDTSSIPDDAAVLSGELLLKIVQSGGIADTHPDSSDQLVLVRPTLASPPQVGLTDYPNFGTLDNPVEGAQRIDVGDELAIDLVKSWPLNTSGLGWIDPAGWSIFGIRTGFDVDNVWFAGVPMDLHVQIRSSDSYTFGPRLVVRYESAPPPPPGPSGAVSGLTVADSPQGGITLAWGASCGGADSDYEVYEGTLGDFTSHAPRYCSTGGATTKDLLPAAGNKYYLVVPRSADREGSYGLDGSLAERPPASDACVPQETTACGG
jgi:hypothetical protein